MHELEYNAADERMALPGWVTRPTVVVQALVSTSFILLWLVAERASFWLLSPGELRGWYLPAGLGVALLWALGLRYAWAVGVASVLGLMAVWERPLVAALLLGSYQSLCYAGTGWLLRRFVPPGRLPVRPIDVGGLIASILVGALATATGGMGLEYLFGGPGHGGLDQPSLQWAGDALGMLLVAPLLVMVVAPMVCSRVCKKRDESRARFLHVIGGDVMGRGFAGWGLIGLTAVGLAVLVCVPEPCDPRVYYLGFIALPALAMRYRLAGGLPALLLTCAAGVVAVRLDGIYLQSLIDLQLIMIALSISTILVGAFAVMRGSAEEKRQAEHRWAILAMRGSGMGRWFWDLESGRLETDYILTDAFGYRRDKVDNELSWWEQRVHPDDVRRNRAELDRLMRGQGEYYEAENRMLAADGSWGWYHSQGTVIERDAKGRPRRIAGTHHDITERKELERIRADAEATHRSEQRFRTLADGAPVAIFQTDAKGVFLYVNPAWQEMTGYEQTDALYRSSTAFAHPEERNIVADHWATAVQTATTVGFEHRFVRPGGEVRWLQTQATPMNHNGVLLGYVGTSVDVTPYREAMAMIRDSEARYRTLADHAYDMLWRVDADARFTYISPSCTKLLGYEPDELVNSDAFDYFHEDDLERVRKKYEVLSADSPEFHDVHQYRRKDGTYIVFEAVGRLIEPDKENEKPYVAGISRDVTQRVEGEKIRRELEEKLARSQKLDAIGTFATGIAHDFRNSLMAINLSAQSVGRKLDEHHPAQPALQTVQDAVSQAMQVTQSLLTFARGPGATKRPTDLGQLIRDNARLLAAVTPPGVDLAQTCPERPVMVQANAAELQQALLNLVMNAKDAIEDAGRIAVTLVNRDGDAVLTVRDNGCGMPREVVDRALEPFYTTKARLKGTGLGLSQVHGIVSDHGGEISIDSAPGIGTTITITLPLIQDQETQPTPQTPTEASKP